MGQVPSPTSQQKDLPRLIHNKPGQSNVVSNVGHSGDGPGFERLPTQDGRIQFALAIRRKHRNFSGLEEFVIFQVTAGLFDGL